jgi:lysophospholipase L1-like esterase
MKPDQTIKKLAEGTPLKIVALGDSLTYGWMVRKGYLDFLEEMFMEKYPRCSVTFINRGIPGDTAEGGLYRLRTDVLDEDPDCVIVQFALNDAFTGYPVERFKNNVESIITGIRENTSSEIVLVTSVYMTSDHENSIAGPFYEKLAELAGSSRCSIARVHDYWRERVTAGAEFRRLVQADMVHPTVEGYRLMAEAIMEIFVP